MALTGWGLSNHLEALSALWPGAEPFGVSVWHNVPTGTDPDGLIVWALGQDGSDNDFRNLIWHSSGGMAALIKADAGTNGAVSVDPYPLDVWTHAAAAYVSSTTRVVWVNGTGQGVDSTSTAPAAPNNTLLGMRQGPGFPNPAPAAVGIGSFSVWDLTGFGITERNAWAAECASGANPNDMNADVGQPWEGMLVNYATLLDLSAPSLGSFTEVGSLSTFASHPPVNGEGTPSPTTAPVVQAADRVSNTGSGKNITALRPDNLAAGDRWQVGIVARDPEASEHLVPAIVTPPAGFELVHNRDGDLNGITHLLVYAVTAATGSEPASVDFVIDAGADFDPINWVIFSDRITGAADEPFHERNRNRSTGSTGEWDAATLVTTEDECLVCYYWTFQSSSDLTIDANLANPFQGSLATGGITTIGGGYEDHAIAGGTSVRTTARSGGNDGRWQSVTVALSPSNGGGPALPDTPTLVADATSWDAVHLTATAGNDTDQIEIYRSTSSPVNPGTDTIVATLTPEGEAFDDNRDPNTAYFYLAVATNVSGSTDGTEQEVPTWTADAVETFVDVDSIEIPFDIPSGERATEIRLKAGTAIRALDVLTAIGALTVEVRDQDNTLVGEQTFSNLPNDSEGELDDLIVPLSPQPIGPQTITVTYTSDIEL